ncbi:hypothetical protein BH11MYX2_BH11MYX2_38790 [soil metagenome]
MRLCATGRVRIRIRWSARTHRPVTTSPQLCSALLGVGVALIAHRISRARAVGSPPEPPDLVHAGVRRRVRGCGGTARAHDASAHDPSAGEVLGRSRRVRGGGAGDGPRDATGAVSRGRCAMDSARRPRLPDRDAGERGHIDRGRELRGRKDREQERRFRASLRGHRWGGRRRGERRRLERRHGCGGGERLRERCQTSWATWWRRASRSRGSGRPGCRRCGAEVASC